MTDFIQIPAFFLVLSLTGIILYKRISVIRKNILMGRALDRSGNRTKRLKMMLLIAFGQKKMFKKFIPAFFHFFIYLGFIIINFEIAEFILDGLTGGHRTVLCWLMEGHSPGVCRELYNDLINGMEFLAVAVILSCIIFLARRNILKVKRFSGEEMKCRPITDANLILIFEILLMFAVLTMNAADQGLQELNPSQYAYTGQFLISHDLIQPLMKTWTISGLALMERLAWWFHILGVFGFGIYITYSKHLHLIMVFPNTYYSRLTPQATMDNMESVTSEINRLNGIQQPDDPDASPIQKLGARDVYDLSWKNLMDAYTCSECGRCTSVCPAHLTGKRLSPRKIMMDVRDRMEELNASRKRSNSFPFEKEFLVPGYISHEEIFSCTTCNACTEACPVNIDPVSIIIQLRRYLVMEESPGPALWNSMFSSIENNFAPWKVPAADRSKWNHV